MSSVDLSKLTAKSADHSIKRARILYNVNPETTFLPGVDPTLMSLSVGRRKRRLKLAASAGSQPAISSSSTALAMITDSSGPETMKPLSSLPSQGQTTEAKGGAAATSNALTLMPAESEEKKPGGILVVSFSVNYQRLSPISPGSHRILCSLSPTEIKIELTGQNTHSYVACSLEVVNSPVLTLGLGTEYWHGSYQ